MMIQFDADSDIVSAVVAVWLCGTVTSLVASTKLLYIEPG